MRIFHFAFLFSLIYSQYHSSEWGSITSLLSPTDIQIADDAIIYASTSGGLLAFNTDTEEFNFIKTKEGLIYLDLATIAMDSKGRLWLGGASPKGCLQIYDPKIGLVKYFDDELILSINNIQIGKDIAFSVYQGTTSGDIGILKFELDEDGLPDYVDYYSDFSEEFEITEIRDLDIFADSVFITTERGVFRGTFTDTNLKSFDNWDQIFPRDSAKQFIPANGHLIVANQTLFQRDENSWVEYDIGLIGESIQAEKENGILKVLTDDWYYEFADDDTLRFKVPLDDQSETQFTSFIDKGDGLVILGMQTYGILILNKETLSSNIYAPDTPLTNQFYALTVTSNGNLAAVSKNGVIFLNGSEYQNFIPYSAFSNYKYYPKASENTQFKAVSLTYNVGEKLSTSIIEKENGNLMYTNSGIVPIEATNKRSAIIELDPNTLEMTAVYDTNNQVIDGFWGIYNTGVESMYMVVNQIEKDHDGNIWIVNPFCEKYGTLLAIQLAEDESWSHIHIPDGNSYLPQTIAIEKRDSYQRAWIGFESKTLTDDTDYSSGGIKVFKYTDLTFGEENSTWISIENPDVLPGNSATASVWSIVFDHMGFLWVLSEKGIQGYEVKGSNKITLDPLREYKNAQDEDVPYDFLTHLSYEKGNRIKVDSQNNKWVITHQGIWVIQESMAYWPSEDGLNSENSGLLSDIVYDVSFDNDKGLAYLATDKGISILQIPFAKNPTKKQSMYISPNPFIIPDHEFVMIKNIPAGATIQIMTITGVLIKKIKLEAHISQTLWNGQNEQEELVGTAVYLVAASHPTESNKVSKIAIIRK